MLPALLDMPDIRPHHQLQQGAHRLKEEVTTGPVYTTGDNPILILKRVIAPFSYRQHYIAILQLKRAIISSDVNLILVDQFLVRSSNQNFMTLQIYGFSYQHELLNNERRRHVFTDVSISPISHFSEKTNLGEN